MAAAEPAARRPVWVLFHHYYDSGGLDYLRVYLDEVRAREDLALATTTGIDSAWKLEKAELFGVRRKRGL